MSIVGPEAQDCVPESLSGAKTLFHLCGQELLDLAAVCQIAAPQAESRAQATLAELGSAHDNELVANQATRAALLDAEIAFGDEDLARRLALLPRLEGDYEFRRKLRAERAALSADLARLEIELLSRSHQAEKQTLEQELADVRSAQDAALVRRVSSDEIAPQVGVDERRQRQIADLQSRRDEIARSEESTFAREEELRQRWITRTVAGFLLWLGYASVVATGSVLALIMSGSRTFELRPLVAGIRAVASSVFPGWPQWLRLLILLGIVLALFRLLIAAFVWCDNLLRERWRWHEEKKRTDATAQMAPQALTTRTYARFIALLPFAFAVASIVSIASSAPETAGNTAEPGRHADAALLTSIFPSVGYSFIGITIAFLAAGVFMMYFIRIIHPRSQGEAPFRNSWEFAIPPLLLLLAISLMPLQNDVASGRWIPWAAFMLASSIALAAGLVFHGIFKDARRAHDRIARIDRRLHRLSGLPADEEEDESGTAATEPLARRQRVLESLLARLPFRRLRQTNAAAHEPQASTAVTAELASVPPTVSLPQTTAAAYRPIDLAVGSDLIGQIEEKRAERTRVDADLQTADATITTLESVVSFAAIDDVSRRLHFLRGVRNALASNQEERRQHARIAKALLALKITSTELAAKSIDPLLASVRDMLLKANATPEEPAK
jgi:MFS family permease